ncbi:hypothetical protein KKH39_01220 [Patescibacteria group bacterium]|nr:hypothetical protein [Patescibacteria group bacterium]
MLSNKDKFNLFIQITKRLNKELLVNPILFGSLGLSLLLVQEIKVNDIDILIPKKLLENKWQQIIKIMEDFGFYLNNENEHQFLKDEYEVAFAQEDDLAKFIGDGVRDFKLVKQAGVNYRALSLEQYLLTYQTLLRDNYRQEKRGTADKDKIKMIKKALNS